MARYLAVRLALAVGVLWAAYTVSFVILFLVPGDPVAAMASGGQEGTPVSEEELAALRAQYGFDDPLLVQYGTRLWDAVQGDFGASVQTGQAVTAAIAQALPNTLQLAGSAFVLAVVLGVGLALVATFNQVRWLRQLLLGLPPVAASLPTFWVGLVLVQWFSFQLGWLPALGEHGWRSLLLPALTLALPVGAILAQVTATCLHEALGEPYIVTARATGVTRREIHLKHALRNAALPVLTVAGLVVGGLLAGSVVVETVFSRAGVGRLTVTSVGFQDLPVVQGIVVFAAAVFVLANLVVDLLLPLADPRVTIGKAST